MTKAFLCVLLTFLIISIAFTGAQVTPDFCKEDEVHGYWNILDVDFSQMNSTNGLNRDIFSVTQNDDKYTYSDLCGGPHSACTQANVISSHGALGIRTRAEERREKAYTSGGVNTRDKFVVKRSSNAITRLCLNINIPLAIPNIVPTIRFVPTNAFNLNETETWKGTNGEFEDILDFSSSSRSPLLSQNEPTITKDDLFPLYSTLYNKKGQLTDLSKHTRPDYNRFYDRNGNETLACMYDYGDLTAFALDKKDSFTTSFTWAQNDVKMAQNSKNENSNMICQGPENNKSVQISTPLNTTVTSYQLNVEYGPKYIAIYNGMELIKNITKTEGDSSLPLGINTTEAYYIDISTLVTAETIPELQIEGAEFVFSVNSIKVTHRDPETDVQKNIFDIKIGLFALAGIAGVGFIAFFAIFACGAALNKRARRDQLDFEEDLLLNN